MNWESEEMAAVMQMDACAQFIRSFGLPEFYAKPLYCIQWLPRYVYFHVPNLVCAFSDPIFIPLPCWLSIAVQSSVVTKNPELRICAVLYLLAK